MQQKQRTYIAIDLKSFYASVECVERGLDPLTTNLVVADTSRTDKTICLAVTPSLKAYGISGRARLFEVIQRLREVNADRVMKAPQMRFTGKSVFDRELQEHPDWEVDYIAAPPRMAHYMMFSTAIYETYLKYVAKEDIHVYSIDEVFMDVTDYLASYRKTAHELAITIIHDVLRQTGITATAGIGPNMYLAKVAMDIVAKHVPANEDGVRIAELDEMEYRRQLWDHKPLTSFWRIGHGIASKLETYGIDTMGKLARFSLQYEDYLYKMFGVNAELLIDHAWGWEPCTIAEVKAYRPTTNSLSSGQVLTCPYTWKKARVVMQEMAESIALDLVSKRVVTDQIAIYIGYDRESLATPAQMDSYEGTVCLDHYGRLVPKPSKGGVNLGMHTSSARIIKDNTMRLFDSIADPSLLVRRLNIITNHIIPEEKALAEQKRPVQLDLFTDYEEEKRRKEEMENALAKERKVQEAILQIRSRFGKNAVLKGINFEEGATARERNGQIGGHKA